MNARDVLTYGHQTVMTTLEGLPEEAWRVPNVCGVWSTKDIVAHLASFEWVLVEVLGALPDDKQPTPTLERFRDPQANFNNAEVAARADKSPTEVVAEYVRAHEAVMALAARLSSETFRRVGTLPWYGSDYALDDFIVYAYYGHKREHSAQIKLFRRKLASDEYER